MSFQILCFIFEILIFKYNLMSKFYSLFAVVALSASAFAQTVVLTEDFSSIATGDNITTTGSTTVWTGNANFPTVVNAYEAGGAVKLGTSNRNGSITSAPLDLSGNSGNFNVQFDVKGWDTVEGDITVSVTGLPPQTYSYGAVMTDAFERVGLNFSGGTAGAKVTIYTSSRRAFIDNVVITAATLAVKSSSKNRVSLVKNTSVGTSLIFGAKANVQIINANGQIVKSAAVQNGTSMDVSNLQKGFYLVTGVVNGKMISEKIIKK